MHVEGIAFAGGNAGGILTAMLQDHQTVVKQLIDRRGRDNPENPAHNFFLPESNPFSHFRWQPGLAGQHRCFERR